MYQKYAYLVGQEWKSIQQALVGALIISHLLESYRIKIQFYGCITGLSTKCHLRNEKSKAIIRQFFILFLHVYNSYLI